MLQLLKRDRTLHANIVQTQVNILDILEIQAAKKQIPSLQYGYKDPRVMNITQAMRNILSDLEHFIGRGLNVDQTYFFSTGLIQLHIHKFNGRLPMTDQHLNFSEFNITIPLEKATRYPGYRTLALMVFRSNPFFGSYYHMELNNATQNGDQQQPQEGQRQEVRSNVTAYVSWRSQQGEILDDSGFPGSMEMEFEYQFQEVEKVMIAKTKAADQTNSESKMHHCAAMNAEQPLVGRKILRFEQKMCQTSLVYSENDDGFTVLDDKIKCSCKLQGFFTISRDELLQPFSEAQGNFDFKNWASFGVFAYLLLLLIFGTIVTSNMDLRDIAKMNDMDAGEDVEYAGIENE